MGLFKRNPAVKVDPEQLRRWRGRSAELQDAGTLPWQVVFEALKTAPDAEPTDDLDFPAMVMAPLGLRFLEVTNRGFNDLERSRLTNVFHGQRYGRPVLMNQGNQRSGMKGAMVTWVSAAAPDFAITASDGRLTVADSAPVQVVEAVRGLSSVPSLWNKVHLVAGAEGVVIKRPIHPTMHPQGWIYDLWLAEHVAHLAAYGTLPAPDPASTFLPYRLDHAHTW